MAYRVHEYHPKEEANKNLFLRFLTEHFFLESTSSQGHRDQNSLTDNEDSFLLHLCSQTGREKKAVNILS